MQEFLSIFLRFGYELLLVWLLWSAWTGWDGREQLLARTHQQGQPLYRLLLASEQSTKGSVTIPVPATFSVRAQKRGSVFNRNDQARSTKECSFDARMRQVAGIGATDEITASMLNVPLPVCVHGGGKA